MQPVQSAYWQSPQACRPQWEQPRPRQACSKAHRLDACSKVQQVQARQLAFLLAFLPIS
jgi:hypothetical protein